MADKEDWVIDAWLANTVYILLDEVLARFHVAGVRHGLTPAQIRVRIATTQGLPQYMQTMLAARYSEQYEHYEKEEKDERADQ
jgi:hypothetical protein